MLRYQTISFIGPRLQPLVSGHNSYFSSRKYHKCQVICQIFRLLNRCCNIGPFASVAWDSDRSSLDKIHISALRDIRYRVLFEQCRLLARLCNTKPFPSAARVSSGSSVRRIHILAHRNTIHMAYISTMWAAQSHMPKGAYFRESHVALARRRCSCRQFNHWSMITPPYGLRFLRK